MLLIVLKGTFYIAQITAWDSFQSESLLNLIKMDLTCNDELGVNNIQLFPLKLNWFSFEKHF